MKYNGTESKYNGNKMKYNGNAPTTGATYQWYLNGNIIAGATNPSHNASINNGTYTVKVTLGSCSNSSAGFAYVSVGINRNSSSIMMMNIYPNPNSGLFTITSNFQKATDLKLIITDASGRELMVMNEGIINGEYTKNIDLSLMAKGIYFVNMVTEDGNMVRRVVLK